ncbi:MAG: hypothetical protein ACK58N_03550 [Synechocystis sp.]|jgi:nucleoside phosphorylase
MTPTSLNRDSLPTQILILAPQGTEFQAIAKGFSTSPGKNQARFSLQSIPAGEPALVPFLANLGKTWTKSTKPQAILVMGVTGSLNPNYDLGQPVLVTECQPWPQGRSPTTFHSDIELSQTLAIKFANNGKNTTPNIPFVKSITTNQVICQATEKQALAQQSGTDVVDMENTVILNFAQQYNIPVVILRVVSDTVAHDLPNLANIYDAKGNLKPWTLTTRFVRRPVAAVRLIRGSLIACEKLQQLAKQLSVIP